MLEECRGTQPWDVLGTASSGKTSKPARDGLLCSTAFCLGKIRVRSYQH